MWQVLQLGLLLVLVLPFRSPAFALVYLESYKQGGGTGPSGTAERQAEDSNDLPTPAASMESALGRLYPASSLDAIRDRLRASGVQFTGNKVGYAYLSSC